MNEPLNFCQLTNKIGTSGQPTAEQFNAIAEDGYTTVINLAMPDSENGISEEGKIVSSLGMSYFHMPIPFEAPTAEHVKKFFRVMDVFEDEKVFVHCAVNARVSAFMFKYLTLTKDWNEEDASTPLLQKWLPKMDEKWKAILELSAEDLGLKSHS